MGTYLFQYAQDKDYVLGVSDEQSGAKVVLRKAQGTPYRFILWDVDQDTGVITLNSSGGQLAIDPQGGKVSPPEYPDAGCREFEFAEPTLRYGDETALHLERPRTGALYRQPESCN
ncbi:hypothetical protein AAHB60_06720 [Pseudomonas aeruginosa]